VTDEADGLDWNVDEQVLQEMKDNYRQVRRKDPKSSGGGGHITISDREFTTSFTVNCLISAPGVY